MKTIAIVNQKGGVAKSTTAHAIGAALAKSGRLVLLIDLDAQGNLTYTTGATPNGGAMDMLTGRKTAAQATQLLAGDMDIIASGAGLSMADLDIKGARKAYRLRDALRGLKYDAAVIDTPPALGVLTINAITAADALIVPAQADAYSVQGIYQLGRTLDAIRSGAGWKVSFLGVLPCRYRNTRAQRAFLAALNKAAEAVGGVLLGTRVRECSAIQEAAAMRTTIFDYAPKSNGAADYAAAAAEIMERIWNE